MTIKYAMLGFLSWRPMSGYDLKKLIADSDTLYWSGNNNQIYRTLVQLHEEGLVLSEVQPQEHLPARKVYNLTDAGRVALRQWVISAPELPQFRNTFLIQLAWAADLAPADLDGLLDRYRHEVEMQALMCRERARRGTDAGPARSAREVHIWQMIRENTLMTYENEMAWVDRLRQGLASLQGASAQPAV